MKRALIVAVVATVLTVPPALPPGATGARRWCPPSGGVALAAGQACCQRQGGVCGCRKGTPRCCNGTAGTGCACRADVPADPAPLVEAL